MKHAHFRQIAVFLLNDSSASLWGVRSLGELPEGSTGLWGCPRSCSQPCRVQQAAAGGHSPWSGGAEHSQGGGSQRLVKEAALLLLLLLPVPLCRPGRKGNALFPGASSV